MFIYKSGPNTRGGGGGNHDLWMMLRQKESMSVPKLITGRHVPWGYTVGLGRMDPRLGVYRRFSREDQLLMRSQVTDIQLVQLIGRNLELWGPWAWGGEVFI